MIDNDPDIFSDALRPAELVGHVAGDRRSDPKHHRLYDSFARPYEDALESARLNAGDSDAEVFGVYRLIAAPMDRSITETVEGEASKFLDEMPEYGRNVATVNAVNAVARRIRDAMLARENGQQNAQSDDQWGDGPKPRRVIRKAQVAESSAPLVGVWPLLPPSLIDAIDLVVKHLPSADRSSGPLTALRDNAVQTRSANMSLGRDIARQMHKTHPDAFDDPNSFNEDQLVELGYAARYWIDTECPF